MIWRETSVEGGAFRSQLDQEGATLTDGNLDAL